MDDFTFTTSLRGGTVSVNVSSADLWPDRDPQIDWVNWSFCTDAEVMIDDKEREDLTVKAVYELKLIKSNQTPTHFRGLRQY